jgi:hypothetical protein
MIRLCLLCLLVLGCQPASPTEGDAAPAAAQDAQATAADRGTDASSAPDADLLDATAPDAARDADLLDVDLLDASPPGDAALIDASPPDATPDAGPPPGPEVLCDGLDDDGDGLADEGLLNACLACGPLPDELCDGLDNDCDNRIDEGLLNACLACGPLPSESCDGVDNDCDGQVDEEVGDCPCGPGSPWALLGGPGGAASAALGHNAAWRPEPPAAQCWQEGPHFDLCGRYIGGRAGRGCQDEAACTGCAEITTWAYAFEPARGSLEQETRQVGPPGGPLVEDLDVVHTYEPALGRRIETHSRLRLPGAAIDGFLARFRYDRRDPWHFDTLAIDWNDLITGRRSHWLSIFTYHVALIEEAVSDDGDLGVDYIVEHPPAP